MKIDAIFLTGRNMQFSLITEKWTEIFTDG